MKKNIERLDCMTALIIGLVTSFACLFVFVACVLIFTTIETYFYDFYFDTDICTLYDQTFETQRWIYDGYEKLLSLNDWSMDIKEIQPDSEKYKKKWMDGAQTE